MPLGTLGMYYFAYGSNMSLARIRKRVPGARFLGCHRLKEHDLRFHKPSRDGSAKCDAYFTADPDDTVYGALFEIDQIEKRVLDRFEGLGIDYDEKQVTVISEDGDFRRALTYTAKIIDNSLKPYSWYLNHVVIGAKEIPLPKNYLETKITNVATKEDRDKDRDTLERSIHDRLSTLSQ